MGQGSSVIRDMRPLPGPVGVFLALMARTQPTFKDSWLVWSVIQAIIALMASVSPVPSIILLTNSPRPAFSALMALLQRKPKVRLNVSSAQLDLLARAGGKQLVLKGRFHLQEPAPAFLVVMGSMHPFSKGYNTVNSVTRATSV